MGGGLARFDTIGLHGIWSWISSSNQHHIVEFIRRHLKPGGVVYNSYNCFPGWAPNAPLRELLALYDQFVGGNETDTAKRVGNALKFAGDLLAAKPAYAMLVPSLNAKLEQLKGMDRNYLAHEYFNRAWQCPYFVDVVEALSAAKLDYACTMELLDMSDQLNLTADAQKFLNAIGNPIMREQARDYFVGRQFRKDLCIKGLRRLSTLERVKRLLETRFVLTTVNKIPMKFPTALGEATLPAQTFEPMIEYLAADGYRPKTFEEPIRQGRLNVPALENMLIPFVHQGYILPCQSEDVIEQVKPQCDALNDYICRRARTSFNVQYLASPVTGMGMTVGKLEQLFVSLIKSGSSSVEELARGVWQMFLVSSERMIRDGKMLPTEQENLVELRALAQKFSETMLPTLRALQIV